MAQDPSERDGDGAGGAVDHSFGRRIAEGNGLDSLGERAAEYVRIEIPDNQRRRLRVGNWTTVNNRLWRLF